MKWYLDTLQKLMDSPYHKGTRAKVEGKSVGTRLVTPQLFEHDMRTGFPLITTKFVPMRLVASELEWFLSGSTRKEPLIEMNNPIWNQWYLGMNGPDKDSMDKNELGRVYGPQWVSWRKYKNLDYKYSQNFEMSEINQVQNIIDKLKTNPEDRRMICLAWNPGEIDQMSLPTCHVMWQINYYGDNQIGLHWTQRSCDYMLGVPFNIASYGLLLKLIAKQVGMEAIHLSGTLIDCHIYDNHHEGAETQLSRIPRPLPTLEIPDNEDGSDFDIFKWKHTQIDLQNYQYADKIKLEVAT